MKSVSSHRGFPCFYITCLRHFYRLFAFNTMHTDFALSGSHGSIWIVGCYWSFVLSCTDRATYGICASRFAQHTQKNGFVFAGADRHWCWEETCKDITVLMTAQNISQHHVFYLLRFACNVAQSLFLSQKKLPLTALSQAMQDGGNQLGEESLIG